MAKILEPFNLYFIDSNVTTFLNSCVQPGTSDDNVLITTGKNSVSLIKLDDKRAEKTWFTKQSCPFTCPVVYDNVREKFIGVRDRSILSSWNFDEDVEDGKLKLPLDVALVLITKPSPLVVFENSFSCFLNCISSLETLRKQWDCCLQTNEKILRCEGFDDCDNVVVLQLTSKASDKSCWKLYRHELELNGRLIQSTFVDLLDSSAISHPLSWCVGDSGTSLVLGRDGNVVSYQGSKLLRTELGKIPEVNETSKLIPVDRSHILITSSPSSGETTLEIRDINYNIKKAQQTLNFNYSGIPSVIGNLLFLPTVRSVQCVKLTIQPSTLDKLVGIHSAETSLESKPRRSKVHVNGFVGKGSNASVDGLLNFKGKNARIILEELEKLRDVSEEILVAALHHLFAITANIKALTARKENNCAPSDELQLLYKILQSPHTCPVLQHHLQVLSFEEVYLLLVYLVSFLKDYSLEDSKKLSLMQVFDWLSCLLDCHFPRLVTLKDTRVNELLVEIATVLKGFQDFFSDLEVIQEWTEVIFGKLRLLEVQCPQPYSIEVLELNFE